MRSVAVFYLDNETIALFYFKSTETYSSKINNVIIHTIVIIVNYAHGKHVNTRGITSHKKHYADIHVKGGEVRQVKA